MKKEFDYREHFENQLELLQKQKKQIQNLYNLAKERADSMLHEKLERLEEKQKQYERSIILAQLKGSKASHDIKKTLDKVWEDIKEGVQKIKEDVQ